jgi:hypothetical protein
LGEYPTGLPIAIEQKDGKGSCKMMFVVLFDLNRKKPYKRPGADKIIPTRLIAGIIENFSGMHVPRPASLL